MMRRRVAVDPGEVDPTAVRDEVARALAADPGLEVALVTADPAVAPADRLAIHPGVPVSPDADPAVVVRGRADLSVRVALDLARGGKVDLVVSASPLAAVVTAARFLLRRRVGVRHPLVATTLHTATGTCQVCDTSGRAGTTPSEFAAALTDLDTTGRVALLVAGGDGRAAAQRLAATLDRPVHGVDVTAVMAGIEAGIEAVVLADGSSGGLVDDTLAATAPDRLGPHRLVGLDTPARVIAIDPSGHHLATALAPIGAAA